MTPHIFSNGCYAFRTMQRLLCYASLIWNMVLRSLSTYHVWYLELFPCAVTTTIISPFGPQMAMFWSLFEPDFGVITLRPISVDRNTQSRSRRIWTVTQIEGMLLLVTISILMLIWVDDWLIGWLIGWFVGWAIGWVVLQICGSVGWLGGWLVGWMGGFADRWKCLLVGWLVG